MYDIVGKRNLWFAISALVGVWVRAWQLHDHVAAGWNDTQDYFTSSNAMGAEPKPSFTTRDWALLTQKLTTTGPPLNSTFHASNVPAGTVTDSAPTTLAVIIVVVP